MQITELMPYQKFRLIDVHSLCHREWFYDRHVIFPRSIKDGLKPVFDIAVLSFKRARQVFLWESKFEWKRMFSGGQDRVGANLTRSCREMQLSLTLFVYRPFFQDYSITFQGLFSDIQVPVFLGRRCRIII